MKFKIRNAKEVKIDILELWNGQEKKILNEIQNITGLKVNSLKITTMIDGFTTNGYYGKDNITLGVKGGISKDDALMVITHELFHIFYWRRLSELDITKNRPGTESKEEWEIAEIAAYLLTSDPTLMKIWPKANVHLYPEIKEMHNKVKKYWKRGDLVTFLIKSYNSLI